MSVKYYSGGIIVGLSTDTKPISVPNDSIFIESDSALVFIKSNNSWVPIQYSNNPTSQNSNDTILLDQYAANQYPPVNSERYQIFVDENNSLVMMSPSGTLSGLSGSGNNMLTSVGKKQMDAVFSNSFGATEIGKKQMDAVFANSFGATELTHVSLAGILSNALSYAISQQFISKTFSQTITTEYVEQSISDTTENTMSTGIVQQFVASTIQGDSITTGMNKAPIANLSDTNSMSTELSFIVL